MFLKVLITNFASLKPTLHVCISYRNNNSGSNIPCSWYSSWLLRNAKLAQPGAIFNLQVLEGDPALEEDSKKTPEIDGFTIKTSSDVTIPIPGATVLIGVSQLDPDTGGMLPAAVTLAEPNTQKEFRPARRFYIGSGKSYVKGTMIHVEQEAGRAAFVDFTGKSSTAALVTHNANGTYKVIFANINNSIEASSPSPLEIAPRGVVEQSVKDDECGTAPDENEDLPLESVEGDLQTLSTASGSKMRVKIAWPSPGNQAKVQADIENISVGLSRRGNVVAGKNITTTADGGIEAVLDIQAMRPPALFQRDFQGGAGPILAGENTRWVIMMA
ncbi:hypothetical protein H072_7206 [Dactylellina haptotyla CBS 200.50]|uniref:Uncharacterized protein n=1 Tax=Dactylellina haptotyla (strain CBS 200.50) TaxID=1284197 RepID=S8A7N7_DACHA|nr:hypothetical protein H072_7206 [Dactylellina haptotyla CBS 200.50]